LGYQSSWGQAIVLEKPTRTSVWPAYSIQKIIWNATNIENIKIEASLDSGRNWVTVLDSYPASAGYYEWEVPNKVSDSCYIRVSDVQNPTTSSTNYKNNPFKIPAPSISLESFENTYYAKQQLPVLWTSSGIKKVNIYLSYDNKVSFKKIASNVSANAFSFNHILKDTIATNCFVAIVDSANSNVADTSRTPFSIATAIIGRSSKYKGGSFDGHSSKNNLPQRITLTNPNKYDSLIGGQKITIKWSGNNLDNIDLLYSIDTLRTWKLIDSNISAQALGYDWKVPNIPTGYGKIMIRDTKDTALNDLSDSNFMIRKKTLVLNSITDTIYKKAVYPIYWNGLGVEKIKIYIGNSKVADSVNALNEIYNWTVPTSIQNGSYVKIIDISDSTILDSLPLNYIADLPRSANAKNKGGNYDGHSYKSNIRGAVNIVYPNGGERIPRGARINFKWTSAEIDYLNLFYSLDSGISWTLADSNIVANLGNYSWRLPNTVSEKVLTKLAYSSDSSIMDYSNNTFTIVNKELSLQIDKTNWSKNKVNQIKWNSFGVDSLSISYKEKDSTKWYILPRNISTNAELFNWYTPNVASNIIEIKAVDNSDSLMVAQDTVNLIQVANNYLPSSYKFKGGKFDGHSFKSNINKIIINKPIANEVLISGKPYAINWDYINVSDTVLLQYSIDSGRTWVNIERVPALLGSYQWVIPASSTGNSVGNNNEFRNSSFSTSNINSDQCLIRVLDVKAGNEVVGMSKGIFSIKPNGSLTKAVVSFPSIADTIWTGVQINKKIIATSNSNSALKYFIVSGSNASMNNDTVVIKGSGSVTIGCYDAGNGNYSRSDTVKQTFCVNPSAPIISRDANNNLISSSQYGNKWYKTDILISDTTKSIKPTTNGAYTVSTTQSGCTSTASAAYFFVVTDLLVLDKNQYIKIDPNPFTDHAILRFALNGYAHLQLEVFQISTGMKVLSKSNLYTESNIQLGQISNGYYLFNFSTPDNKYRYQFKMLKL
jgi:hypothetical protein